MRCLCDRHVAPGDLNLWNRAFRNTMIVVWKKHVLSRCSIREPLGSGGSLGRRTRLVGPTLWAQLQLLADLHTISFPASRTRPRIPLRFRRHGRSPVSSERPRLLAESSPAPVATGPCAPSPHASTRARRTRFRSSAPGRGTSGRAAFAPMPTSVSSSPGRYQLSSSRTSPPSVPCPNGSVIWHYQQMSCCP